MYYLMNKDKIAAEFTTKPKTEFSDNVSFEVTQKYDNMPIGFGNINDWIDNRKASKHNTYLKTIMKSLGCDNNESFICMTHAASINDTFWIKSDREKTTWNNVSLYRNQFSDVVSTLAFEGVDLYDTVFSSTSPELTCEGSFRKCFKKEKQIGEFGSDIYIYKRGGEFGKGYEPYCEKLSSEIARIISPNTVCYELSDFHKKAASKCSLFTDEKYGYAAFSKINTEKRLDLQSIFEYYQNLGCEQQFREMLVIDAMCFNQDRHSGNFGVLFDNDSMEIVGMAPSFDMNISLFSHISDDDFADIGDKLFEIEPKLGDDFTRIGQMAINDALRDKVKDLKDFTFSFRGDDIFPESRVKCLEIIIQKQAESILSKDKLYTKDIFFSSKAQAIFS